MSSLSLIVYHRANQTFRNVKPVRTRIALLELGLCPGVIARILNLMVHFMWKTLFQFRGMFLTGYTECGDV